MADYRKEVKIQAPKGYEIDKENSTFECVKFKPIVKKNITYEGWQKDINGEWYFGDFSGKPVRNEWKKSGDNWFYLDSDGMVAKALQQISIATASTGRWENVSK